MNSLSTIFIMALFSLVGITSNFERSCAASSDQNPVYTGKHNLCCHYCRISKNRRQTQKNIIAYVDCTSCPYTFCAKCIETYKPSFETGQNCPVCNNDCCCNNLNLKARVSNCDLSHKCCFTTRRTLKRWKKRRRTGAEQRRVRKRRRSKNKRANIEYLLNNENNDYVVGEEFHWPEN